MQELFDDSRALRRGFARQANLARVMVGISILVWWGVYFWTISRGGGADRSSNAIQLSLTVLLILLTAASFKWPYIFLWALAVVYGIIGGLFLYMLFYNMIIRRLHLPPLLWMVIMILDGSLLLALVALVKSVRAGSKLRAHLIKKKT